jgi:transcriptional regulator with XRE-family HTH domain
MESTTTIAAERPVPSRAITPRSVPDKELAAVLRRLRLERDLSQEQLAHSAFLTTSGYVRIEAATAAPGWSTVRRIAEALGVSMGELGALVEAESLK